MQSIAYQSSNILENLYTDGLYTYITTPTVCNMQYQFQSIITYCNSYIPTWKPCYNDPRNRLAFNPDYMFEIIFYKNLILVIPLYISSHPSPSSHPSLPGALEHIKSYCSKLTSAEDGLDSGLTRLLDYKIIFYTREFILLTLFLCFIKSSFCVLVRYMDVPYYTH